MAHGDDSNRMAAEILQFRQKPNKRCLNCKKSIQIWNAEDMDKMPILRCKINFDEVNYDFVCEAWEQRENRRGA